MGSAVFVPRVASENRNMMRDARYARLDCHAVTATGGVLLESFYQSCSTSSVVSIVTV